MLKNWIQVNLIPYMTLKQPNKKHSVYVLKHIVEKRFGRYVSQEKLQAVLQELGYPVSDYYPISERFFKEVFKWQN